MSSKAFGDSFAVRPKAKRRMGIPRPGGDLVKIHTIITRKYKVAHVVKAALGDVNGSK